MTASLRVWIGAHVVDILLIIMVVLLMVMMVGLMMVEVRSGIT